MPEFTFQTAVWFFTGMMLMWAVMAFINYKIAREGDFIILDLELENDGLRAHIADLESRACDRCGSAHCRRSTRRKEMKRGSLFGSRRYSSASRREPVAHKSRWSY